MKEKNDMSIFELANRLDSRSREPSTTEILEKTMAAIDRMVQSNIADFSDIEIPKFEDIAPLMPPVPKPENKKEGAKAAKAPVETEAKPENQSAGRDISQGLQPVEQSRYQSEAS